MCHFGIPTNYICDETQTPKELIEKHHHRLFAALMPDFFAHSSRRMLYTVVAKYLSSMSVIALRLTLSNQCVRVMTYAHAEDDINNLLSRDRERLVEELLVRLVDEGAMPGSALPSFVHAEDPAPEPPVFTPKEISYTFDRMIEKTANPDLITKVYLYLPSFDRL